MLGKKGIDLVVTSININYLKAIYVDDKCKDSIYMGDNWAFCSAIKA